MDQTLDQDAPLLVRDLGRLPYGEAWAVQRRVNEGVIAGDEPFTLLLVEHEPVITISRRPGVRKHLLADAAHLDQLGIAVHETDRGGDITYHGPGQLVAYPIVNLRAMGLTLSRYMRWLEQRVIEALDVIGVEARQVPGCTGVWVDVPGIDGADPSAAKVCALGIRVRRHVTMHGLALNVDPELSHFDTIVPCGLTGKPVTSLRALLGERTPGMSRVKRVLVDAMQRAAAEALANAASRVPSP